MKVYTFYLSHRLWSDNETVRRMYRDALHHFDRRLMDIDGGFTRWDSHGQWTDGETIHHDDTLVYQVLVGDGNHKSLQNACTQYCLATGETAVFYHSHEPYDYGLIGADNG